MSKGDTRSGFLKVNSETGRHIIPGGAEDENAVGIGTNGTDAIDHTWEGDGTDDREIDLGDDYDLILIFLEESKAVNVDHLALAYAFRTAYGVMPNTSAAPNPVRHYSMAAADAFFQGKMTGGDADKIKLGSSGGVTSGVNVDGETYRLVGMKFRGIV